MRIGIDGRVLLGRKTGDRTYTYNLLRVLAREHKRHDFVVCLDKEPDNVEKEHLKGLRLRVRQQPRGHLWTLFALPQLAKKEDVDLLHVQYLTPFVAPCPVVTTVHDISFKLCPQWFSWRDRAVMNTFLPGSLRRAAAVIAPSESTAIDVNREYGCPNRKIFVTPYAASYEFHTEPNDDARKRCRDNFQIVGPYMLYVGNIQPRKNIARLVRAFVDARKSEGFPEQLVVVGQFGWRCGGEQRMIAEATAAGHVKHLGYVDDEHLPALYAEATAFLFPTLYEGFGLPVLEAMAVGTPVLTSNVSSLPEVAGEAAAFVDPTDEAAIASAISQLVRDADLRDQLSRSGRARAQMFSWKETARLTVEAYERAASQARN